MQSVIPKGRIHDFKTYYSFSLMLLLIVIFGEIAALKTKTFCGTRQFKYFCIKHFHVKSANWDHGTFRTTLSWILSTEKGLIKLQRYWSWVKDETIDVRHWRKLEYEVIKLSANWEFRMSIGTISKSPHITKLAEQRELFAGIKRTSGGRAAIPLESELELCDIIEN
ncbi:hypothetical protein KY290_001440 [Solanum tuberosum]|uniref:Uncharacterized protein n=1 Tax=Solanum tuberosum TaxID=4113 RepID=A0ABQ7WM50_SOLTU|nr:hypothetical protein KY290_001440 [Solanum tuberosum]